MWQFKMDLDIHLFRVNDLFLSNFPLLFGTKFVFGGGNIPNWLVFYVDIGYILRIKRDNIAGEFSFVTHSVALGFGVDFFPIKFFYIGLYIKVHMVDIYYFYGGPVIGFRI